MPPELLSFGIFAIEEAIKHEPEIAAEIKSIFSKADPTPEDWAMLRARIHLKRYRDYVTASALPPIDRTTPPVPALVDVAKPVNVVVLPTPTESREQSLNAPGPVTVVPDPSVKADVARSTPAASQSPGPSQAGAASQPGPSQLTPEQLAHTAGPDGIPQAAAQNPNVPVANEARVQSLNPTSAQ